MVFNGVEECILPSWNLAHRFQTNITPPHVVSNHWMKLVTARKYLHPKKQNIYLLSIRGVSWFDGVKSKWHAWVAMKGTRYSYLSLCTPYLATTHRILGIEKMNQFLWRRRSFPCRGDESIQCVYDCAYVVRELCFLQDQNEYLHNLFKLF